MNQYVGRILDERFASRSNSEKPAQNRNKQVVDLALKTYEKEYQSKADEGKGMDPFFRQTAIDQSVATFELVETWLIILCRFKTFIFAGHDTTSTTIAVCG